MEDTTIRHKLLEVIKARYTYIEPNQLSNTGCLRIELYGYEGGEVPSAGKKYFSEPPTRDSMISWKQGKYFHLLKWKFM